MLGFSFEELVVCVVLGGLLLKPEEIYSIARWLNAFFKSIKAQYEQLLTKSGLNNECEQITGYIIDIEGKMQKTYNTSDIIPNIKEE